MAGAAMGPNLTVVATATFIPIEVYEIAERVTSLRLGVRWR